MLVQALCKILNTRLNSQFYIIRKYSKHSSLFVSLILYSVFCKGPEPTDLIRNIFTGNLPQFFQNMTSLQFLDLSSFPRGASNFANLLTKIPSLLELHLAYYNLKETHLSHILHNLTTLSNIQHIDLSHNRLTGSILETIGRLATLTTFSVRHNKLSGTIPVSIWQLSKLRSLDVSYNSLEGEIYESHLANLSMLKEFNVGSNSKLTLNVSREWLSPFQLRDIDLSSCKIGNGISRWLLNQRKLYRLVLSNTTISGPLPIWLR
ncbi:putative non-specific serine/threonine protein kinase [Helianthus debilis subsp. tardiflorus]